MKKVLIVSDRYKEIYPPLLVKQICEMVDLVAPPQRSDVAQAAPQLLEDVEIVMSGWGAPRLDRDFLDAAPRLEAFFYAAGSTQNVITSEATERGIICSSAIHFNSIPVAEYTFAQIILCLKHVYAATSIYRQDRCKSYPTARIPGAYGSTVGLIGFGNIARLLVSLLSHIDVKILVCDPAISSHEIDEFGAEKVSLEEIFSQSDVVSLHAPQQPSTDGIITEKLLRSMKQGASFINTSRGSLVREDDLVEVLRARPDLYAVLDVTNPEPPEPESALWFLPNLMLTPHISGSQGIERHRVGQSMIDELGRYLKGRPLHWPVQLPIEHAGLPGDQMLEMEKVR